MEFKDKRGIKRLEHEQTLKGEWNAECRAYYSLLWNLGGSQSDAASLRAEDVDWEMKVISFDRMKTGSVVQLHFGLFIDKRCRCQSVEMDHLRA
ncbi:MAG: Integrase family protein [Verrucomicrobiales bacterium]|nr:Integrase family protein [Verrucomicrobiales bacterium]